MRDDCVNSEQPVDLAGLLHWNSIWSLRKPHRVDRISYYDYRLSNLFHQIVSPRSKVLEVGCGGSVWLPYFAKSLRCEVWGIDYSTPGVDLALHNLKAEGVSGTIILGDIFADHQIPRHYFDVLWTSGFIEHFEDIQCVIRRLTLYLKPGGLIITVVPNLYGLIGWLHRVVDRRVYNTHAKLDPGMVDRLHLEARLGILFQAHYFGVFSLGVVNFDHFRARFPKVFDMIFWAGILGIQQSICLPFRLLGFHPETRWLSPWIIGVYRLPK